MKTHNLKLNRDFFDAVRRGDKTSEIRKADRFFMVGDVVVFRPVCERGLVVSPVRLTCEITHIVRGGDYGIHRDYDMLSIRLEKDEVITN